VQVLGIMTDLTIQQPVTKTYTGSKIMAKSSASTHCSATQSIRDATHHALLVWLAFASEQRTFMPLACTSAVANVTKLETPTSLWGWCNLRSLPWTCKHVA